MPQVTITYLEMRSPDGIRPKYCTDPRFAVREATVKQWEFNRFLYSTVGAAWNWTDKLTWSPAQWKAHAESDALRTYVAYYEGSPAGFYELHASAEADAGVEIEIGIYGLLPAFYGRGFGGALLTSALEEAWKTNPNRVWVHTCTDDHPAALPNYQARGMQIYRTEQS